MDLSRALGSYQAIASSAGGGMMTQTPTQPYQLLSPQMMVRPNNASPMTPGFGGVQQTWVPQGYAVPQLATAYTQYDNGTQHVSAQQPPRLRYERAQSSAQVVPTAPGYDQLPGMWGMNASTSTSARPPASPSRNAEISASILKRGSSAEAVAEGNNEADTYVAETTREVDETGQGAPPSESAPEMHQIAETHRVRTPPVGSRKSQSERLREKPSEPRSAPSGRIDPGQAPVRDPLPITDLDFAKPRRSPVAQAAESELASDAPVILEPVQIVEEEGTPAVQLTPSMPVEDEYEEPVYASIRPRE